MDVKDPYSYPVVTYLWVIGLACFGGVVRHLNSMTKFSLVSFLIDLLTSGFTGLVTFWLCQWGNIDDILGAVLIATSGLMGNKAWKELEHLWRIRMYRIAGVDPRTDGLSRERYDDGPRSYEQPADLQVNRDNEKRGHKPLYPMNDEQYEKEQQ